jgi:hypothetical protein
VAAAGVVPVAVWSAVPVVRGLVAVFMTVRRCSYWSVVAKISRWCRPWRGLRMNAPWVWRRASSLGSVPSASMVSAQRRATRARKSGSDAAAVAVRFSSMRASFSGVVRCWSRFRVRR